MDLVLKLYSTIIKDYSTHIAYSNSIETKETSDVCCAATGHMILNQI